MTARKVTLGTYETEFPSSFLQQIDDCNVLWAAHDFEGLRTRLHEDGYLYLRNIIPTEDVVAARELVLADFRARGGIVQDGTRDVLLERCGLGCVPFIEGISLSAECISR
jgi:hypothetical protein